MAQATQTYRRSLSGSVGAGMKSVFGGNGRTYYTLVHKVSSKYHRAGESQPIIVDEIEIGRDPRCQVRFDDSFTTVSRRHAAIVRDGDQWKLVQLSTTNSTYLNGHHVHKEWYLQNGDEIQLSTNGPKLGFIIPEGEKSKVSSIGLTARLNLFRQQALRPYKTALTILGCVLLLALGGLTWSLIKNYKLDHDIKIARQEADEAIKASEAKIAHLMDTIEVLGKRADSVNVQLAKMEADNAKLQKNINGLRHKLNTMVGPTPDEIKAYAPYVYFIMSTSIEVTMPNGTIINVDCQDAGIGWMGTGFLLKDGTFVTARHVAEPWYFWADGEGVQETFLEMNIAVNNGGRVVARFIAVSSSGDVIEFSSRQMNCRRYKDQTESYYYDGYGNVKVSLAETSDEDIAWFKVNGHSGGLEYASEKSRNLKPATNLTIIGFPFGLGVKAFDRVNPSVSNAKVASDGLEHGMIVTTGTSSEYGDSGGPVFINEGSKLVVVGVVSSGFGKNMGMMVPISAIK